MQEPQAQEHIRRSFPLLKVFCQTSTSLARLRHEDKSTVRSANDSGPNRFFPPQCVIPIVTYLLHLLSGLDRLLFGWLPLAGKLLPFGQLTQES